MEVVKPSWIKHADDKNKRQCIFTSDVDYENKRLATGGMDSVIRIWRLSSIFGEVEAGKGHLLASMTRHNGSVLCLRWSSTGLLASSSDDTIILIWQLDARPAGMRGNLEGLSDEGAVEENYKVVKRLIGHQSDTVGVEWSPDGSCLASCSLDGTICFWNADSNSAQTLLVKLEQAHKGFIKGLAWDPSGRFLASQSDDGSCAIWNVKNIFDSGASTIDCSDEGEAEIYREALLEEMFINTSKMTFFHRPSWSPDASMLALANSANRHIPVAALVDSSNWQGSSTNFVGHLSPIEVVKFNPCLFTSELIVPQERKDMICAVAGQDGQVSIWSSAHTRPIIVLQDIFEHTIMDLSWSRDGTMLMAVSYDGTVAAIKIDPSVFDLVPLTQQAMAEHLRNALGNRKHLGESAQSGNYMETVDVIKQIHANEAYLVDQIHEMQIQSPQKIVSEIIQPLLLPLPETVAEPIVTAQTVTVTKDGKKRITPQLLSVSAAPGLAAFSAPSSSNSFNSQSFETNPVTPGRTRLGISGSRLRDEDFVIHRRILQEVGSSLLGSTSQRTNIKVSLEKSERSSENMSMSVNKNFEIAIEVFNQDKSSAVIQMLQGNTIQWKERVKGSIYLMCGSVKFTVYALKMGEHRHQLLVLSPSGRRLFPMICLDAQVLKLLIRNEHLVCLTDSGQLSIWDLSEARNLVNDYLPTSILAAASVISKFDVDSNLNIRVKLISTQKTDEIILKYDLYLRKWIDRMPPQAAVVSSIDAEDRLSRLEKLKKSCLNDSSISNDRQISELEFELALLFINFKNKTGKADEIQYFEKILAMYAVKLAKDSKSVKARELISELKALKMDDLVEGLLKPIFCQINLSHSWQDFVSSF